MCLITKARRKFSFFIAIIWLFLSINPLTIQAAEAFPLSTAQDATAISEIQRQLSQEEWVQVDKALVNALETSSSIAEEYAHNELESWSRKVNKKIDKFLDWHFGFWHTKTTELGVPFAWMGYKVDFLNVLRSDREKYLNADEIIQARMTDEFNRKFMEIVFDDQVQQDLLNIVKRVGPLYANSLGFQFSRVQAQYQIPSVEWERHTRDISNIIYNTGTNEHNWTGTDLTGNLFTEATVALGGVITVKVVANLAAKAGLKIVTKSSTILAAESIATVVNPLLGIAILAWDVWDYKNTVAKSRPDLKKNLEAYIQEFQYSLLENAEGTGIMDVILAVENDIRQAVLRHGV
ncbi:MAG: hypothetical protein HLUCCO16_11680 [Phormidium sp. OSCR]|nr:MAG: hypothetical protein HLUCCO16_11680 [Phormidium sp. OSCR]